MCPSLSAIFHWLRTNQQSLAIWIEGLALVAIFGLELKEYKRQGRDRVEQQRESAAQMKIAQDAANAAKASAEAARLNAQAVINAERPWIVIEIERIDEQSYQVRGRNKGRTPADMIDGYFGAGVYPIETFTVTDDKMGPFFAPLQPLTAADDWFEIVTINCGSYEIDNAKVPPEMLYSFGRIRYWDTFTDRTGPTYRPYETRWCVNWISLRQAWVRTAIDYSRYT
jgi:hypothetical protein